MLPMCLQDRENGRLSIFDVKSRSVKLSWKDWNENYFQPVRSQVSFAIEDINLNLFIQAGKTLIHQGSMESTTDQQTGKKLGKQDSNAQAQEMTSEMEMEFKILMETTGSTTPMEVLERFIAQKESTSRLNYLRTVTEGEKKHLEIQRETLLSQLETSKFSDVKENEM